MLNIEYFIELLNKNNIDFFTGIPDSLLKDLGLYLAKNFDSSKHIIAANEGGAIALATGYHLATSRIGLVYMQNSGTGNAINPLLSLADPEVYSIPMLIIIGWRGQPDIKDEPQHKKQGRIQEQLLSSLGYKYEVLSSNDQKAEKQVDSICNYIKENSTPGILLIKSNTFNKYESTINRNEQYEMTREQAIKVILEHIQSEARVVSTTGMTSREIYEIREKDRDNHKDDFLTVGSMGHAIMIALGLSNYTNHPIFCIDGDGAAIMHMGSLGIAARYGKAKLNHIIINNGAHESVGGQPTIGYFIDFKVLALSLGYKNSYIAYNEETLIDSVNKMIKCEGPNFLEVRVKLGHRDNLGRPKTSPKENKEIFMQNI